MLAPLPPALITSGDMAHPNVMTAAWTGIICSDPVITYVSLRPSRYTHELVSQNKEFVINLPTWRQAEAVDTVGVKSGRDGDKFAIDRLNPGTLHKSQSAAGCRIPGLAGMQGAGSRPFGTHDMFLAEVVAVNVDDKYIDESGALDLERPDLSPTPTDFITRWDAKSANSAFRSKRKRKSPPRRPLLRF